MADFEFFKKEFEFKGKHAKMAQELWVRDDTERTYFKRLIDLYVAAAIVGFRVDRKAEEDYFPGTDVERKGKSGFYITDDDHAELQRNTDR